MNIISTNRYTSLFLIITSLLSTQQISYATDTINTSHILRDDNGDTLTSSGGTFELGFFRPGTSKNRYVGIWYKKITIRTVVWVANKGSPLTDRSGTLKVAEPGILVLLNGTDGIIWSTNTSSTVKTPVAKLLDSGNLVVKDATDDDDKPDSFLWQSFDYPTDTLLPGMKLGWNFRTGLEVYITSPKSSDDPASGDFTLHFDLTIYDYPQLVIRKGTDARYRSGPWNGIRFSGSRDSKGNGTFFKHGFVINKNEAYYHYEVLNNSVFSRFTLSESGAGERLIWADQTQSWTAYITLPRDNCDIDKGCGPYGNCKIQNSPACRCLDKFKPKDPQGRYTGDWSIVCVRRTLLNCQNGDAFLKYSGIKLPDTRNFWFNKSMTLEECKVLCTKNCSCMAYALVDISRGGDGCLPWFGDLVDIREIYPGQDIYIRMASSELGKNSFNIQDDPL